MAVVSPTPYRTHLYPAQGLFPHSHPSRGGLVEGGKFVNLSPCRPTTKGDRANEEEGDRSFDFTPQKVRRCPEKGEDTHAGLSEEKGGDEGTQEDDRLAFGEGKRSPQEQD